MTYKYYFKYRLENGEKGTGSVCASDIESAKETAKNRFGAKIDFYDFTTNNEPCFTGLVTLIPNETETNEQEENTMEIRHNEYADMPYIEFCKKFHRTLKRYPGMECAYNPHYAYEVTTTKYYKVGSKWHEKTDEKTVETVPGNYYMNMIDAIPFFRNLGGSERVQMGYTLAGYIPTQLSSISPDGKEKILRKFKPVQI